MRMTLLCALLLDLALWFGGAVYFSCFAALELFHHLPLDTAGQAVGVLFPTFFGYCTTLSILGLILYLLLRQTYRLSGRWFKVGLYAACVGVLTCMVNSFFMLPKIQHIETEMGPISHASAAMQAEFGMYHGISMLIALVSVLSVFVVWVALSGMWSKQLWRIGGEQA